MVTEEALTFGVLLSRYRAAMGFTQEDLAERAGLSARGIGDLERGVKTRPQAYTVRQLAEALQLSPDDRTLFERAARAGAAISAADEMPPEGRFLGAVPANELLGREEERERIRSILAAVEEGRGHLLLLGGEVGAGKKIDGRTDIYALGAVLYHMVTGRPPLEGNDVLEIAVKQLQEAPRPPTEVNAAVPADWESVILKALAKDPAHRFQTATELKTALKTRSDGASSGPAEAGKEGGGIWRTVVSPRFAVPGVSGLIVALLIVAVLLRGHPSGAHASHGAPAYVTTGNDSYVDPYSGLQRAVLQLHV